ncbi:AMP-binding protein [Pseudooceanicola sp. C21-150M6]|uniref:non-ribosomal peptide synthetase n=1 Tax=Pseudooceanicola sp. C21-150M6 TaxID=3434355 RepID=UPI003D7F5F8F
MTALSQDMQIFPEWDAFVAGLQAAGDRPALLSENDVLHYSDLLTIRDQWRRALDHLEVTPQHRVVLLLPDDTATAAALLSLIDHVSLVPLSPDASPARLIEQIEAAEADLIIWPEDRDSHWRDQLEQQTGATGLSWRRRRSRIHLTGPAAKAPRSPRGPGLVLHTSGSTGTPKRVPLSPDQLVLSARNIAGHLALTPEDRAVHALPMFHVGAVVDLLLAPLLAGGSAIVSGGQAAARLRTAVLTFGATWIQLVPTSLQHFLEALTPAEAAEVTKTLRLVRMVSADLPEHLLQDAENRLPLTEIIQMYGMTETAGQITSQLLDGAARTLGSVGVSAGPELALIDSEGAIVAQGRDGEVCVRGPTVMAGYEGTEQTARYGDWLRTGDIGRLDSSGNLYLTGRLKEMINRGGEKISPLVIERAARALPGVLEATAFALPHPTLGEQPGLAVVTSRPLTEAEVLAVLKPRLSPHEMPRHVSFEASLPRLPSGKTDRRALAARAQPVKPATEKAPASPIEAVVSRIWQLTLNGQPPEPGSDFFDDGGDSLSATEFLMRLEKALGRPLPPNLLFEAPRFDDLAARLDQHMADTTAPAEPDYLRFVRSRIAGWRGQPVGARGLVVARNTYRKGTKVFFCANGLMLPNRFEKKILAEHPVFLLRSLHGMGRDRHQHSDALAAIYVEEILSILDPGEAFILGGYCAGGLVMQRVADEMTARGRPPSHFVGIDVILDRPTPYPVFYIWSDDPKFSAAALYKEPWRRFGWLHPEGAAYVHCPTDHIKLLQDPEQTQAVRAGIAPVLAGLPAPRRPHPESLEEADRKARYSARIRARIPRLLSAGRPARVRVTVTNTSHETWPPTALSGIALNLGYESLLHRRPYLPRRQVIELTEPLHPGESLSAEIELHWPATQRRAPLFLCLRMVDDGIADFDSTGQGRLRRLVMPAPGR